MLLGQKKDSVATAADPLDLDTVEKELFDMNPVKKIGGGDNNIVAKKSRNLGGSQLLNTPDG